MLKEEVKEREDYTWREGRTYVNILPRVTIQPSDGCLPTAVASTVEARIRLEAWLGRRKKFKGTICPHEPHELYQRWLAESDPFKFEKLVQWCLETGFTIEPYFHKPVYRFKFNTKFPFPLRRRFPRLKKKEEPRYRIKGWTEFKGDDICAIKEELQDNGPVSGFFKVRDDYPPKDSGPFSNIYEGRGEIIRSTDESPASHVVMIIGWGKANDTEYWIVQNSYGEKWGENGFHRMTLNTIDAVFVPLIKGMFERIQNPEKEISWTIPDKLISSRITGSSFMVPLPANEI